MNKKIQVTTVNVTNPTDIQVITLNAYFISKAVEAKIKLANALRDCKYKDHVTEESDEDGNETKGHDEIKYNHYKMTDGEIETIDTEILPFLEELVKAFTEE